VERAHITGLSLGAATGMWLAAKHPQKVKTLSLHSAWPKTDPFLRTVVESWRELAKGLSSVTEMVILGIFPWCFTPELYAAKPDYVDALAEFVRSRPMPDVDAFLRQSQAVLGHDAAAQLGRIAAPTQVTFGRRDLVCSTRFADALTGGSRTRSWWCSRTARTPRSTRTSRPSTTARWHSSSSTRDRRGRRSGS
jgi:pimeloyl-ACP methyl ester carboxylesterase